MNAEEWDRMVDRNDPDIDFLVGQRVAAIMLLKKLSDTLTPEAKDYYATAAMAFYDNRLYENEASILHSSPAVGDGFRDFCKMFRDSCFE